MGDTDKSYNKGVIIFAWPEGRAFNESFRTKPADVSRSPVLAVERIASYGFYVLSLGEMNVDTSAQQSKEWIDGFLFVGNQFALDFLNTRLINEEGALELLPDPASLSRWLNAVGLLKSAEKDQAVQRWQNSQVARRFLRDLLVFREELRSAVLRLESGKNPEPAFLQELNKRLLTYPHRYVVVSNQFGIRRQTYLDAATNPSDLWRELADSAAHLLTEVPVNRLRKCEGCVVNFYDISKKGSRRWCSMHICGNREKVSTYRRKQRAQEA